MQAADLEAVSCTFRQRHQLSPSRDENSPQHSRAESQTKELQALQGQGSESPWRTLVGTGQDRTGCWLTNLPGSGSQPVAAGSPDCGQLCKDING